MSSTDLVLRLIRLFDSAGVPYMLVGSFSSNLYGRPRSTKDADFVVVVNPAQLKQIARELGPDFKLDEQMSFETVTMTMRHIVYHPASAFKIEMFLLSEDPHDQERFRRRRQVDFEGTPTWLPAPEDVVVTKLRWSKGGKRSKDVDDVRQVLAVRGNEIDRDYIRRWCDQHGTRSLFEQLLVESRRFEPEQP